MKAGERVCLAGGVALLALTFLTKWYGVVGLPSRPDTAVPESTAGPWHELSLVRWLILATALAALVHAVASRLWRARRRTLPITAALATVTSLCLVYRVLVDPPGAGAVDDVKLGAYLALLSVVAIALGAARSTA